MKKHAIFATTLLVLLTSGCTNITPQDVEFAKQAFLQNDTTKCEQITDETARDMCIVTIAQKTKNPDLCEKVYDNQSKEGCIVGLAFSTQNPLLCDRISNTQNREDCKKNVAEIQKNALKAAVET